MSETLIHFLIILKHIRTGENKRNSLYIKAFYGISPGRKIGNLVQRLEAESLILSSKR